MVRQEARLHMTMLLASHSHHVANLFDRRFEHEPRVRSSNRVEMQEINAFWENELREIAPRASREANQLPVDKGMDVWLDQFYDMVMPEVIHRWRNGAI